MSKHLHTFLHTVAGNQKHWRVTLSDPDPDDGGARHNISYLPNSIARNDAGVPDADEHHVLLGAALLTNPSTVPLQKDGLPCEMQVDLVYPDAPSRAQVERCAAGPDGVGLAEIVRIAAAECEEQESGSDGVRSDVKSVYVYVEFATLEPES